MWSLPNEKQKDVTERGNRTEKYRAKIKKDEQKHDVYLKAERDEKMLAASEKRFEPCSVSSPDTSQQLRHYFLIYIKTIKIS